MGSEDYAGWITFGTKIDNKYFEREIRKAAKELEKLDDKRKELQKKQDKIDIEFNIDKENLDKQYQKMLAGLKQDMDAQKKLSWSPFEEEWYGKRLGGINQWYEKELQGISGKHDDIKEKIETVNEKYRDTKKIMDELIGKYDEFKNKNGDDGDEDKGSPISPKKLAKSGKGLEGIIKKVTRWGLALFGIRGAYSMIRRAMADISQENKQVGADIEYMRWAISKTLEPVIIRIVNWFMKLMKAINYVVYKLTGVKLFSEATADNFKKASGNAKELQKTLAGFDEMNIVGSQSSGGGGGVSLPSEDLNDFSTLSDDLIDKLNWIVKKLQPIWDFLVNVKDWLKDNPEVIKGLIAGLIGFGLINKILKLVGVIKGAGGLKGALEMLTPSITGVLAAIDIALLVYIEEYIRTKIIPAAQELHEELKEQNDTLSQTSNNWEELRNDMLKAALQDKDNVEANKKLQDSILKNIEANDTLTDGIKNQSWFAQYLIGDFSKMTDAEKILVDERNRDIQSLEIMNKAGILQKEGKEYLIKLYGEEIEALEKQTKNTWLSTEERKKYNDKLQETREKLKAVTDPDWVVKVEEEGTDESKQKAEELGKLLSDSIDKTFEAKISADTKPANKKISSWIKGIGSTAFGVLFSGIGIGYTAFLNKFNKYAKGGIINLPGYGVPIGGEAGREGVVPLTDEQQMQLLGESIGKYITINLTNITKLDSREINRKNEKVRSENTFIRNR